MTTVVQLDQLNIFASDLSQEYSKMAELEQNQSLSFTLLHSGMKVKEDKKILIIFFFVGNFFASQSKMPFSAVGKKANCVD